MSGQHSQSNSVPSKVINLRLSEELLAEIDKAAADSGQDRSNWLRSVITSALYSPSSDKDLVSSVNVIDERARQVVVDLISRVERLEGHCFGKAQDPFGM